ncbi:Imm59 family immunity protein [Bacillus cereus]|uniref:Imm59 family immunity protein n=1 Tax=Bacillus cereus TaxID=1396 RepID=UPI000C291A85|nr:Imm59 family immunity protein [Bacillus cereus]
MNIKEAIRIIYEEKLQDYNMNEVRDNRENEVVLRHENDKWIVYVTDERASKITNSQDTYVDEEEALDDFIDRLRADKILREL